MTVIIKYDTSPDLSFKGIVPAIELIPDWYKKIPVYLEDNEKSLTVKRCMPFFDSLSLGYHMILAQDVYFVVNENEILFKSELVPNSSDMAIFKRDKNLTGDMVSPRGYAKIDFTWLTQVSLGLPEGYSALFTHPLNRFDLPFITLSGVVDGEIELSNGNIPFYIEENFEGIIKKGTPIIQIIPFKRENFSLERKDGMYNSSKNVAIREKTEEEAYPYRKKFRKRKIFK